MVIQGNVLNIVPISFGKDKIKIGRIPKMEKDEYFHLREMYWKTHSFRFDHRYDEVLNIALDQNVSPLGDEDVVDISNNLFLVARAVQQSFLIWLAGIRKSSSRLTWGMA